MKYNPGYKEKVNKTTILNYGQKVFTYLPSFPPTVVSPIIVEAH